MCQVSNDHGELTMKLLTAIVLCILLMLVFTLVNIFLLDYMTNNYLHNQYLVRFVHTTGNLNFLIVCTATFLMKKAGIRKPLVILLVALINSAVFWIYTLKPGYGWAGCLFGMLGLASLSFATLLLSMLEITFLVFSADFILKSSCNLKCLIAYLIYIEFWLSLEVLVRLRLEETYEIIPHMLRLLVAFVFVRTYIFVTRGNGKQVQSNETSLPEST